MLNEFTDTNIPDKIQDITQVIDNLLTIRAHINRFGITPQFLHLVDDNKQLSHSLKIDLEEFDDSETTSAAIAGNIKKAIAWIKELFVNLYKKAKDFIKFLLDETEELKANFQRAIKYLNENIKMTNSHFLKKIEVEQYPLTKLISIGSDIEIAIDALYNNKPNKDKNFFIENDKVLQEINDGLRYLNKKIEEDKIIHNEEFIKELNKEKEKSTLDKLGYSHQKLLDEKNSIEGYFDTLEKTKEYEKKLREFETVLMNEIKDQTQNDKATNKKLMSTAASQIVMLIKLLPMLNKALLKVIRIYCTMAIKMPKDTTTKPKKKDEDNGF